MIVLYKYFIKDNPFFCKNAKFASVCIFLQFKQYFFAGYMVKNGYDSHHSEPLYHDTRHSGLVLENVCTSTPAFKPVLNSVENFSSDRDPRSAFASPVQIEKQKTTPLEPFCSKRLLPTRHQTKNAVLSILKDGEVCIEFLKKRGSLKKDMVCEVMRISPDGLRIILYEPEGGHGVALGEEPPPHPPQGADKIYGIQNLPEKHRKKYSYASKFIDLVRAKTPKVTYYTDKAKCFLMESLTDFEVCFYDGM